MLNRYEIMHHGLNRFQAQAIRVMGEELVVARPIESTTREFAQGWVNHLRSMSDQQFRMEARMTEAYNR